MRPLQDTSEGVPPFPIRYYSVQPNRWTFESDKIREWVESFLNGAVLNAMCGRTELEYEGWIHRNDINEDIDADTHYDVENISHQFEPNSFDTIIHDPPYSETQAETHYNGHNITKTSAVIREYHKLLRPGGRVIGFGFTTTLMPGKWGYEREEVAIFNTLGRQNDWLGTVDRRLNSSLNDFDG